MCLYLCVSLYLCHIFACVWVCSGVLCGSCGPSTWLWVQQESRSREQQHRGADGVLRPELVSIVLCNWIWSGRRDGCQWEPAIIRCEWDVWYRGLTHTAHTHLHRFIICWVLYCSMDTKYTHTNTCPLIHLNQKMCVHNKHCSAYLFSDHFLKALVTMKNYKTHETLLWYYSITYGRLMFYRSRLTIKKDFWIFFTKQLIVRYYKSYSSISMNISQIISVTVQYKLCHVYLLYIIIRYIYIIYIIYLLCVC